MMPRTIPFGSLGDRPAIADREVHVWQLPLVAGPSLVEELAATLSWEERARAARFAFPELRMRYTIAHGLLREVLATYVGVDPTWLRFHVAPRGKPMLVQHDLGFNLSHSSDTALLAVAPSRNVGVDVEEIRPDRDLLGLARSFFAPAEAALLAALPERERALAFYRCWTRKEAYLKACGVGLALRLDAFEVTLAPGEAPALLRSERALGDPERWSFSDPPAPPGFAAALAVDCGVPDLVVLRLEIGDA